ncbi:MAG: SusC/RagA family TonB-linked outer membrane protein [Ginsengibacter sp.]
MRKNLLSVKPKKFYLKDVKYMKIIPVFFVLFSISHHVNSQNTITGTVSSNSQERVVGANVIVKGTPIGAVTDSEGNFRITSTSSKDTLVFSITGYLPQEIPVNGRSVINVQLQNDNKLLDDVVIVGYGKEKKVNLTGAVDQVGSEYFENRPVPNVSRALQGVIPNLNIRFSDGKPTTSPEWNIRGLTSIGAGGSALVLIDGVWGDPANLNPDDIESVTVLKDAASAAIYGSRGSFGVVLITTKSPKKSKPQITYSGSYAINQKTVTPDLVTDGYTWAKSFNESYSSWYDYNSVASSIGSSGLPFSSSYLDSLKYRSEHPGALPDITINPSTGNYVYYGNTDWYKVLYNDNIPSMDHSLSVAGGDDKLNYRVSGRYYDQAGMYNIRQDKYSRYNLRITGGVKVTPWLLVKSNTELSSYQYSDPFRNSNIWGLININGSGSPLAKVFNPDGTLTQTAAGTIGVLYGESESLTKKLQTQTNLSFVADIIKSRWTLEGNFAYLNYLEELDYKNVPIPYSVKPGTLSMLGSSLLGQTLNKQNYYTYNLFTTYAQKLGDHQIKLMVGGNMEISRYNKLGASRDELLVPGLSDLNLAVGQNQTIVGGGYEWATTGVFSRINYNFRQKYLLEINGRYDGTSKFPVSKQFGFFPSVSAGWRISEESFMDATRGWLDNLKVRGSYGSLGNSNISPYVFIAQLKAAKSPVIIGGSQPAYISAPAALADKFTWETATTSDIGIDADLLKYRLSASFDWYERKTTDMITAGPLLPVVFGASVPRGNYADLKTKGFEASLKWNGKIKTQSPISYSVRLTLADNVSYITRYNNPQGVVTADVNFFNTNYYVNQRVGDIWGLTTEGLFTSADDIAKHADQSAIIVSSGNKLLPGDIKFKDLNGDGKINQGKNTLDDHGDWSVIGNSSPRYTYGITTDFSWKNLSLSMFFQGVGKRDWYPSLGAMYFWGQYTYWYGIIPTATMKNRWTEENPDPNAYWPRLRGPMVYGPRELQAQTRYLQNASYIRLKDLTIGYSLPSKVIQKIHFQNVQVYFTGQNIWTYSPMFKITKDIDPEVIEAGPGSYDGMTYPMLKSYTFGLKFTL